MIRLEDFTGRWRLSRAIEDARAGITGRMEGEAVWTPVGAGLRQEETGLLRYGIAPPMQARRQYLWSEDAGRIVVQFDDGRPFHDFTAEAPRAKHDCPPDIYDVAYDFSEWPRAWSSRWHVTGPRKAAIIRTSFLRDAGQ